MAQSKCMESVQLGGAFELPPLPVSVVSGASWGQMEPVVFEEDAPPP